MLPAEVLLAAGRRAASRPVYETARPAGLDLLYEPSRSVRKLGPPSR
jgi:hypothetical protein